jgi:hypothetical protein
MPDDEISLHVDFKGFFGLPRTRIDRILVPKAGIEPARLAAVDFESTASTDFATSALKGMRKTLRIIPLPPVSATLIRRRRCNC